MARSVRITADEDGMQVLDAATNRRINVAGVSIHANEKGMTVHLLAEAKYVDIKGVPTYSLIHPLTGAARPIASIVFDDGEVWRAAPTS